MKNEVFFYAESYLRCAWGDTDDLNESELEAKNDLHFPKEGYKLLGQRFAEKAIVLISKTGCLTN